MRYAIAFCLLTASLLSAEVPAFFFLPTGFEKSYIPDPLPNNSGVMVQIKKPVGAATVCVSFTTLDDGVSRKNCGDFVFQENPVTWAAAWLKFGTEPENVVITAVAITVGGETKTIDAPLAGVEY